MSMSYSTTNDPYAASTAESDDSDTQDHKQPSNHKWNRNGFGQAIEPTFGKFSRDESDTVKHSVEQYCRVQGVTPARLCSESDNRTDHLRGAWMEIAKELPHRTVQSVYRHGLRLMHPFKRGAWGEEESHELLCLVATHGKKWAEIQSKLNRSADSCRDKYREFNSDYTKGKWQESESSQLEMYVRAYLKVGKDVPRSQLGKIVEQDSVNVPWSAISKKMKNRSRLSCFKRFQQITGMKKKNQKRRKKGDITVAAGEGSIDSLVAPVRVKEHNRGINQNRALSTPTVAGSSALHHSTSPSHSNEYDSTTKSVVAGRPKAIAMRMAATPNPIQTDSISVDATTLQLQKLEGEEQPRSSPVPDPTVEAQDRDSYDRSLILTLASSNFVNDSDVGWSMVNYPLGDAQERWNELLDKWLDALEGAVEEDEIMDRPIWELAKMMMENEVVEDQAAMAARTVAAVFLC